MDQAPRERSLVDPEALTFESKVLNALPIVNHMLSRLGVEELLERYVPTDDKRLKVAPAKVLGVLIRSLIVERKPVYSLGRWAQAFEPATLGLSADGVLLLNDDRAGRALDRLFDADRASLLTELVVGAIKKFRIDCSQLHNDSTSIPFQGNYSSAKGQTRGGKPTPKITHGHSKDYRPDLKQLLWILTITADGAVPIAHRVADGNTEDGPTHIPTWDALVELTGDPTFLYVADCKLCSREAMDHISSRGGRFLTPMVKGRREEGWFREYLQTNIPQWEEIFRREGQLKGQPDEIWRATESPIASAEGYRIIWIWSSSKQADDQLKRQLRIEAGMRAMKDLHERLIGKRPRFKSRVAVEQAAKAALVKIKADRWVSYQVSYTYDTTAPQRNMSHTSRAKKPQARLGTRFSVGSSVDADAVARDAKSDGWFPLITNERQMSAGDLLAAHKYQPKLESRHADLKGTLEVIPMFLKNPERIEALLLCEFIALLVHSLIEREIRAAMAKRKRDSLPLYPENRASKAPTAPRVLETFSRVMRIHLMEEGTFVGTIDPQLNELQSEILGLLKIPLTSYSLTSDQYGNRH